MSLRSVSSDNFVITDHTNGPKVIGETDFTSALSTLHPKAIYMVEGKIYQVEELDFIGRKAHVREVDCDYYTTAINYTKVTILDRFAEDAPKVALHGEVHVVSRVVGFKKIRFQTNENVGSGELDLPEQQMHTTSYWLEVPLSIMNALPYATDDRRDGVVGLAFAMKQVAQLLLMCDARDIGLSVNAGETAHEATHGRYAADLPLRRLSRAASASARRSGACSAELLSKTSALIASCDCESGCPVCVGPDRRNRSAREDGGVADSCSICWRRRIQRPLKRSLSERTRKYLLAWRRSIVFARSSNITASSVPTVAPDARAADRSESEGFSPRRSVRQRPIIARAASALGGARGRTLRRRRDRRRSRISRRHAARPHADRRHRRRRSPTATRPCR